MPGAWAGRPAEDSLQGREQGFFDSLHCSGAANARTSGRLRVQSGAYLRGGCGAAYRWIVVSGCRALAIVDSAGRVSRAAACGHQPGHARSAAPRHRSSACSVPGDIVVMHCGLRPRLADGSARGGMAAGHVAVQKKWTPDRQTIE